LRAVPRLPDDEVNVSKRHPLGEGVLLILGASVGAATIFSVLAWAAELLAPLVPLEVEAELMGSVLEQVAWDELEQNPAARKLTQLVGRLAGHWPDDPYEHQVIVTDDDTLNAFALPGGLIMVTRGLLDALDSENEIAFVLGHELGHFKNRDHLVSLGRSVLFQLTLSGIGLGGGVSSAGLIEASGDLVSSAYDRDQEREADRFALQLLHAEYGHIGGAKTFLERLTAGALIDLFASFAGSHPASAERIDDVLRNAREHEFGLEGEPVSWNLDDTR